MKFFRSLNTKFSDPKMEREYTAIRSQNIVIDFKVTICVIILITLTVSIENAVKFSVQEFTIATSTIVFLVFLYLLQRYTFLRNYALHLTIFVLIAYNAYRLIIFKYAYYKNLRATIWFAGYTFAILQMILIGRLPGNLLKIVAVMIAYAVRFGVILGAVDPAAAKPAPLIRAFIVDAFIVFYYYFNERADRRVFQNFYENREELLKFKELLDDFPQSVTVVDASSIKPLFANTTFAATFEKNQTARGEPGVNMESSVVRATEMNSNEGLKRSALSYLQVDQVSIREVGASSPNSTRESHYTNEIMNLNEIIEDLVREKILHDKSLSLTATLSRPEERKTFAVTLKKMKWDRTDAVAVILNDITYQENVIALKSTIENKDKIIATVAHELRTPLNSIIGLLSLAQNNVPHPEALKYVLLSRDNAQLLLSLVNSHLDFQMISAGKLRINPSKVDLAKVLDDITQLLQFQTGQKGIYLKSYLNEEVSRFVTTDENRLKQILLNLMGNAIKFTSSGGIRVEVYQDSEESKCLKISVIDTGMGIGKEDKGKLFQMYGRLEDGRSVNKTGVGLGLMISNALALLMSGKTEGRGIEVESEHGIGSTFSFKILKDLNETCEVEGQKIQSCDLTTPKKKKEVSFLKETEKGKSEIKLNKCKQDTSGNYEEEPMTPIHLSSNYVSRTNNQDLTKHQKKSTIDKLGMTDYRFDSLESDDRRRLIDTSIIQQSPQKNNILVVDDNPFNLLVTENILKEMGYSIKTALGGKESIEIVKNFTKEGKFLKVILMDCHMPGMDGYETSRELKKLMSGNEVQKVPIIAMTANNDDETEAKKCFEAGMEGFLTKSSPPDVIRKAFAKLEQ